ncbi:MAG: nucleotide exchange factor GrpE, partial [Paraclostridium sp.]
MEEKNVKEELNEEIESTEEVKEESQEEVTEESQEIEVDEKDSKIEELTDSLQRLQAEYSNYRRRTQQEKETIGVFANEKILTEL